MFIERYLSIKTEIKLITLKARTVITFRRGMWERPVAGRGQEETSRILAPSVLLTWVLDTELLVCTLKYTFLYSLCYI